MKKELIQKMTGMSDIALYTTIFETGMAYLSYEVFYDQNNVSLLSTTKEYWEFWNTVADSRTNLFIKQFNDSPLSQKELRYIYEALLDVRSLSVYPPDFNWSDGYYNYVTKLLINIKKYKTSCV